MRDLNGAFFLHLASSWRGRYYSDSVLREAIKDVSATQVTTKLAQLVFTNSVNLKF